MNKEEKNQALERIMKRVSEWTIDDDKLLREITIIEAKKKIIKLLDDWSCDTIHGNAISTEDVLEEILTIMNNT